MKGWSSAPSMCGCFGTRLPTTTPQPRPRNHPDTRFSRLTTNGDEMTDVLKRLKVMASGKTYLSSHEMNTYVLIPDAIAEITRLRTLLQMAGAQFRFYAEQHRAKGSPDGDAKAATNEEWATRCFGAAGLNTPPNGPLQTHSK